VAPKPKPPAPLRSCQHSLGAANHAHPTRSQQSAALASISHATQFTLLTPTVSHVRRTSAIACPACMLAGTWPASKITVQGPHPAQSDSSQHIYRLLLYYKDQRTPPKCFAGLRRAAALRRCHAMPVGLSPGQRCIWVQNAQDGAAFQRYLPACVLIYTHTMPSWQCAQGDKRVRGLSEQAPK
jgi:hypothetical protein